jgi:gliding motility-associated-like protein
MKKICICIFTLLLTACISVEAQITSTFNANAEGWTTPNDADGTITYSATGGNPGGFVAGSPFQIILGATTLYVPFNFVAPVAYRGNRSAYYNGTLQYDIQQSTTGTPNQYPEVTITNNLGISLYYFPAASNQPPAAPAWATYQVLFNNALGFWKTTNSATGPLATEAQILNTLADLANLEIRGLYRDANTTNRLDNVSFRPPILITLQPTSTAVCNGVTTSLTTTATNNPAIIYQWQRESTPGVWANVTNTGGYSGATTNTLSVNTTGNFGAGNYRCRISGLAVSDAITSTAIITINPLPAAPTTTGASSCGANSIVLTAAGAAAGQYRWYTVATGGTAIAGQTNATYTTPVLASTTTYYVAINNGTCESTRTAVIATINTPPNAPTATGSSACGASSVTLTAVGAAAGQYRWYTVASGGTAIAGQTNASYTTPVVAATTIYYVAINNGTCESTRTAVTATINTPPNAPTATGSSACGANSVTLTAAGAAAGQYRWYTLATGGTAIVGQTNASYTTPVVAATTIYYVAINNGTCESTRTAVTATINTPPVAPAVTGSSACGASSVTLTAAGAAAGQYRWYTLATGGTAIAGQTNATYTTPVLATTTNYYVAINNGTCESVRTLVTATIFALPPKPAITASQPITAGTVSLCLDPIILSAPSGFASYSWSGGQITQQVSTVQTGNFSVTVRDANGCNSPVSDVIQVIPSTTCVNNPPVINSTLAKTVIGGKIVIDLSSLISDPDGNLDPASLVVVGNGTQKGGATSLNGFLLEIDYATAKFSGKDLVTIRVCDLLNVCFEADLEIEVFGDIVVYNGISPNGDLKNDTWEIEYITLFPDTQNNRVTIYNRWGDVVWEATNYDNDNVVFTGLNNNGSELSTGTYFYKIEFESGRESITGYLSLKR